MFHLSTENPIQVNEDGQYFRNRAVNRRFNLESAM